MVDIQHTQKVPNDWTREKNTAVLSLHNQTTHEPTDQYNSRDLLLLDGVASTQAIQKYFLSFSVFPPEIAKCEDFNFLSRFQQLYR